MVNLPKIVIAAGIFYPDVGGPAIHSREIAEALVASDYKVDVVAYGFSDTQHFSFKIKRVSRSYPGIVRWLVYFCKVFLASIGADVIYAFDLTAAGMPAFLTAKILGKKFLIRIGGDPIWERVAEKGKRFLPLTDYYDKKLYLQDKPVLFKAIRWILNKADAIVVYSDFFKNFYHDYYGIDSEKIKIILNPISHIETAKGLGNGPAFAESYGEVKPIFIFAGRFVAYKNLKLLLRAFDRLRQKFKRGHLKLIGKGPEEQELKKIILELSLQKAVEILPSLDQKNLFDEIKGSSVCFGPALTEFNPNFILECLSFGKPVILSRDNGLSVALPEEFLFDPKSEEDLIKKMEPFFDARFYEQALNKVKNISMEQTWEKVIKEHLELIKQLSI